MLIGITDLHAEGRVIAAYRGGRGTAVYTSVVGLDKALRVTPVLVGYVTVITALFVLLLAITTGGNAGVTSLAHLVPFAAGKVAHGATKTDSHIERWGSAFDKDAWSWQ